MTTTEQICVYTALTGNYERLKEQPVAKRSSMPFICFTDDPNLRSDTWDCRLIRPLFPMDPVRSQRDIKLRPHLHLPDFAGSIYIDNSTVLEQPPEAVWAKHETRAGFTLPHHNSRETLLDEFIAVSSMGLDENTRIFEQLNHYMLACPDILKEKPFWAGFLLREHHRPELRSMAEIWAAHVLRYSRRDQLSINMAFREAGFSPAILPIDNLRSTFHTWSNTRGRNLAEAAQRDAANLMPLVARLRQLEQREREVQEVRRSVGWRLTEPVRWLGRRGPALTRLIPRGLPHQALAIARRAPLVGKHIIRAEFLRRFRTANGHKARLDQPLTFNDHLAARILNDRDPRLKLICDKIAVREIISRDAGPEFVVPLLGVWESPEAIDWDMLPDRFVLKPNHASGPIAFVRSAEQRDPARLTEAARQWLAYDYFDVSLEWGYRGIPRRLLAEPVLQSPGGDPPIEMQIFTFGGRTALVRALTGGKFSPTRLDNWFTSQGKRVALRGKTAPGDLRLDPVELAPLVAVAEALSAGFAHMRVDFLLTDAGPKVNELSPYTLGGTMALRPTVWNERLGRLWTAAERGEPMDAVIHAMHAEA